MSRRLRSGCGNTPGAVRVVDEVQAGAWRRSSRLSRRRWSRRLKAWVESRGVKIGDIVHPLRVAVTGKAVGFGLFDTLAILGRERSFRALIGR